MASRCRAVVLFLMPLFSGGVGAPTRREDVWQSSDETCAHAGGARNGGSLLQVVAAGLGDEDAVRRSSLADTASKKEQGWCKNGIASANRKICCDATCGTCSAIVIIPGSQSNKFKRCQNRPGGRARCCRSTIKQSGKVCSTIDDMACIIPKATKNSASASPPAPPTISQPLPPTISQPLPDNARQFAPPPPPLPPPPPPPLPPPHPTPQWADLGAGCCTGARTPGGGKLFAGGGFTVESCKSKCLEFDDCSAIDYFSTSSKWCWIWSTVNDCSSVSTSCPNGNTARAYKLQTTSPSLPGPSPAPVTITTAAGGQWTDVGKGCCTGARTPGGGKLFAGGGFTVESCKSKCLEFDDCSAIDYFTTGSQWCWIWSTVNECLSATTACPNGNMAHAYKYRPALPQPDPVTAQNTLVEGDAACLLPDLLGAFDEGLCDPSDTSGSCVTENVPPPPPCQHCAGSFGPPRPAACAPAPGTIDHIVVPHVHTVHMAAPPQLPNPNLLAKSPCPQVPRTCYDPKQGGKEGIDGFKQTSCFAALLRKCQAAGSNSEKTACILAGMCSYGRAGAIKGSCRICSRWLGECLNNTVVRSYMDSSSSIYEDLSDALPSSWGQLAQNQNEECNEATTTTTVDTDTMASSLAGRTLKCPCGLLTCPDARNAEECNSKMAKGDCQWVGGECKSKASLASTDADRSLLRKSHEC